MVGAYNLKVIILSCSLAWALQGSLHAVCQIPLLNGDTLTQQQFIQGCARYRQSVIEGIETSLSDFVSLVDALAATSSYPEVHYAIRDGIIQATLKEQREVSKGAIYQAIHRMAPKDSMALRLYEHWLNENSVPLMELQFLVANGILDSKPPYKLGSLQEIWQEFSFYGLEANMTIADIGAGNGLISFILLESGLPLSLILTEVDDDLLKLLGNKIEQYPLSVESQSLRLEVGNQKNLGLRDVKVDVMIFREVFHHFKYPKLILQDISNFLKEDGYVVLKEGTKDLHEGDPETCKQATTYKRIIKEWTSAGFALVQEKVIDGSYMLKFKRDL